jgi:short-subunit dehydrogenase
MEKVVLITGASTGIGNETAKLFQTKNWKVAATMRSPEKAEDLQNIVDVECIRLDVTDADSIRQGIEAALNRFGRIDVVVNNAGYGLLGPFEAATDEQIERQFQTNVFGVMYVCRHILPYFREQKRGTIVNVASIGGRMTFPFSSLYHATKWAVEGFSESLHYELRPLGIKVKIIEPGPIKTDFYSRSMDVARNDAFPDYDVNVHRALDNMRKAGDTAPDAAVVAQTIYNAVTDGTWRLRYGVNTKGILLARRLLPESAFFALIRKIILN